jgi:hypothetical protein
MRPVLLAACLVLVGLPLSSAAQPSKAEDLAIQAREILRRHCSKCHDGAQPRAELNILDHPRLIDPTRLLVVPRAPNGSRLLELIEDGSMPQGEGRKVPEPERNVLRAWIDAGAPAVTRAASDAYVMARILEDVALLGPADRPYARYLSLNHLLTDAGPQAGLETFRTALEHLFPSLTRPGERALRAIEPTETVFHLDLRAIGWESPVLTRHRPPLKPDPLNRFDLVLLEYPYGVLPVQSKLYSLLGREFLEKVPQVRPLPFVRGDWFLARAVQLAGLPPVAGPTIDRARQLFEQPLNLAAVPAEFSGARSPAELQAAFGQPTFEGSPLAPLAKSGTVPRAAWEKSFASAVRALDLGTPVLPLDGLTFPSYQPDPPIAAEVSTRTPRGQIEKKFALKELMVIVVESKARNPVVVEVVWANAEGKMFPMKLDSRLVMPGQKVEIKPKGKEGFEVQPPTGTDQIILYAFEADEGTVPTGEVYMGEKEKDRFVHPFYAGWHDGARKPFEPSRAMKMTIAAEIIEKR